MRTACFVVPKIPIKGVFKMANLKNRHNNLKCSVCGSYDIETLACFQDCNDLIMHDDKYSRLDDYNVLITLFFHNYMGNVIPVLNLYYL